MEPRIDTLNVWLFDLFILSVSCHPEKRTECNRKAIFIRFFVCPMVVLNTIHMATDHFGQ